MPNNHDPNASTGLQSAAPSPGWESVHETPDVDELESVDIHPKPDADVCGASGCRETDRILKVVIDGFGRRAVCATHGARLIHREVLDG